MSYKRFGEIPEFNLPDYNPPLLDPLLENPPLIEIQPEVLESVSIVKLETIEIIPKDDLSLKPVIDRLKRRVLSIKSCYK